jgi:hypothetical protein
VAGRARPRRQGGLAVGAVAKAGNYGTGINAGRDKYNQAMTAWLPVILSTGAAAKQMPGATLQQRIARSAYVATTLYNRKRGL